MSKFNHDWFSPNIPNLTKWLAELKGKPIRALEVGCFEGRSTCWFLENILTHPDSSISVIDTFQGSQEHRERGVDFTNAFETFLQNLTPYGHRVKVFSGKSQMCLRYVTGPFALAYIDGSHAAPDVLTDACMTLPLMAPGGLIVFDDYLWTGFQDRLRVPRIAVDAFLDIFSESLEIVAKEYQVCVRVKAALLDTTATPGVLPTQL